MRARGAGAAALALLFSACSLACGRLAPRPSGGGGSFVARQVAVDGTTYDYRVFLPAGYVSSRSWPVLLFLHGSGERGEDNVRQTGIGLGPVLRRAGKRFPLIAVFPQCRGGEQWFGAMERQALAALEQATSEFHGDRRRTYVTGVSIGGTGAWYMARQPHRFAAVVPVSGEIEDPQDDPFRDLTVDVERLVRAADPYAALAGSIGNTPVWVFHGRLDGEVPVREARAMVAALRAQGGKPRYTEYFFAGHAIWDRVYNERALPRWLLAQHLE